MKILSVIMIIFVYVFKGGLDEDLAELSKNQGVTK